MATVKRQTIIDVSKDVKKWGPSYIAMGMQTGVVTLEIVQRLLKMSNINLPRDPAISLLGICPREMKTYVYRRTYM